jgi:hypothetical protein
MPIRNINDPTVVSGQKRFIIRIYEWKKYFLQ